MHHRDEPVLRHRFRRNFLLRNLFGCAVGGLEWTLRRARFGVRIYQLKFLRRKLFGHYFRALGCALRRVERFEGLEQNAGPVRLMAHAEAHDRDGQAGRGHRFQTRTRRSFPVLSPLAGVRVSRLGWLVFWAFLCSGGRLGRSGLVPLRSGRDGRRYTERPLRTLLVHPLRPSIRRFVPQAVAVFRVRLDPVQGCQAVLGTRFLLHEAEPLQHHLRRDDPLDEGTLALILRLAVGGPFFEQAPAAALLGVGELDLFVRSPCRSAFWRTRALPDVDFGPVLRCAFRRLAAILRALTVMTAVSRCWTRAPRHHRDGPGLGSGNP